MQTFSTTAAGFARAVGWIARRTRRLAEVLVSIGDAVVRPAIRVLTAARDLINTERTRSINALTPLLRIIGLGIDARASLTKPQIATMSSWRFRQEDLATTTARRQAIRSLSTSPNTTNEPADNRDDLTALVAASDGVENRELKRANVVFLAAHQKKATGIRDGSVEISHSRFAETA